MEVECLWRTYGASIATLSLEFDILECEDVYMNVIWKLNILNYSLILVNLKFDFEFTNPLVVDALHRSRYY